VFRIYFKTAWRSVKKNKGFFALNFLGLYISIVVCILIALILLHETSFDRHPAPNPQSPADKNISVYRVVSQSMKSTGEEYNAVTPYPLASAMRAAMPDERLISQIHYEHGKELVTIGNKKFNGEKIIFADSVFPRLFPLTLKAGSLQRAFAEPGFVVLTESTSKKYFGQKDQDAIGKRIRYANSVDLEVAAVIADPPANTHLPYIMLVSYPSLTPHLIGDFPLNQWGLHANGYVYIGLPGKDRIQRTDNILAAIVDKYVPKDDVGSKTTLSLQPLPDIHFNQQYAGNNPSYTINYSYLYLLGAIGLFLILAACINYTNLSTALAIKKSKEVGVRKTMGATRGHLMKQFLSETFLLTALVIVAAAFSVRPLLPILNNFLDKNIPLNWMNVNSGIFLLCLWVAVSLLSGIYPAFVLSGFNPIAALKSKISTPKTSVLMLRRGLVVFQFLTAQILIIGAIVVAKQLSFMQSTPLGFDKQNVLDIDLPDSKTAPAQAFRDRVLALPGVSSASLSLGAPVSDNQVSTGFNLKEKYATEKLNVAIKAADRGYLSTYGLQLMAGRWFDQNDERATARSVPDSLRRYAFVLNETAVKALGFTSPQDVIGRYVTFGLNDISAPVIGVIKDYHIQSMHKSVLPVLMVNFPAFYYDAGIKFSGGYSAASISSVAKIFESIYPNDLFESRFLNDHLASLYKEEKRTQQLFNLFTFLSIVINVLGLVGLLSFMIEQRTKEIGVRKVLGASIANISIILSKDFIRLIGIAFLIAAPIAWYIMNNWLQEFAYRTPISWWIFAVTIAGALLVTCLAVGYQTLRAALMNPVKSLRSE
jgi:putative ABC transport system permease protein